jgi:UDP-N-acetylglucosamine transferase subunit ALG13
MIYVTTGTHPNPFDRLIGAMEAFAATTDEAVIIQAGTSRIPLNKAQRLSFVSWDDSQRYIRSARVVVAHAGIGTLIDVITAQVPIIVWPRLARYGEVVNDHQLEIANVLSQQGRVIMVNDAESLFAALRRETLPTSWVDQSNGSKLVDALRSSLDMLRVRIEAR